MRAFAWFLGIIIAGLAAMALFAYPAWLLLQRPLELVGREAKFNAIAGRIGELALLVGLILIARHLRIADRRSLGYGLPARRFVSEFALALAIGVLSMLLVVGSMIALGLLQPAKNVTLDTPTLVRLVRSGLLSGLAVGIIEETFLRGAMFSAIARESGARLAIILTSLVYAATHFIATTRIAAGSVTWTSGFDLLAGTFRMFSDPLRIFDAFLCLFAVGVILGMVRALTGNIAACMGLHAGWVCVILTVRRASDPDPASRLSFLLSGFDGMVGWLVLAWIVPLGALLYYFYAARSPRPST
jgi:hypothetical protein